MTLTELIQASPALTDAEIVAAWDARPEHWQAVPSNRVLAWMAEAGRKARLDAWLAATASLTDPQIVGLRSAVEVTLLGLANPTTQIETAPGSQHRAFVASLVQAGALTQPDADALIARGRVVPAVTATDVTAARLEAAKLDADRQAVAAVNTVLADAASAAHTRLATHRAAIHAARNIAHLPGPLSLTVSIT